MVLSMGSIERNYPTFPQLKDSVVRRMAWGICICKLCQYLVFF